MKCCHDKSTLSLWVATGSLVEQAQKPVFSVERSRDSRFNDRTLAYPVSAMVCSFPAKYATLFRVMRGESVTGLMFPT